MSRLAKVAVAVVVIVAVAGAALYWFVLRDDSPAKVDVACGATDTGDVTSADPSGTWTVRPTSARGDALLTDEAPGSWAGYRIEEDLRAVHQTAVGRTPDITGTVTVEGSSVTKADFKVDMTSIKSDQSFRDNRMKTDGLQTDQFPTATFALGPPVDLGATRGCRQATASGTLTLHGQAHPVTLHLKIVGSGDGFTVNGTTRIKLADYGIDPPKLGFVTVDPAGDLEVSLRLSR